MATYGRQRGGGGGGASSWIGNQLTRAQAVSPLLVNSAYWEPFLIDPGLNSINQQIAFGTVTASGGTVVKQAVQGGVYRLNSNTTINGQAYISSPNNSGDQVVQNLAGGPFYMSIRARFLGATNAAETKYLGAFTNTFASYCMIYVNNGVLKLIFIKPGQSQMSLTATYTPDYSNAHDYAIGFDGTTIGVYVDGALLPGSTTTNLTSLPTAGLWMFAYCDTTAGGSSSSMDVDDFCLIVPSLA